MRLIIAGFGNVGIAFSNLVARHADELREKYGLVPRIVAIVDSKGAIVGKDGLRVEEAIEARTGGSVSEHKTLGHKGINVQDVLKDVEADVLLELTPSNLKSGQPGLDNIEAAMNTGLSVVTTNKGPLAVAMPALLELAEFKHVLLRFSGTVGGGTPVLQLAKECLAGDRIVEVEGILNGTTNYILSRMHEGVGFDDALVEARRLGYAEADSSMDTDGFDTAAKLVILSNWAVGGRLTIGDVATEGIRDVNASQIAEAKRSGGAIKLVGLATDAMAMVNPKVVLSKSPLCVDGALNAVALETEHAGRITLVGYGSGGAATAAAALRDLVSIKRTLLEGESA